MKINSSFILKIKIKNKNKTFNKTYNISIVIMKLNLLY